MIKQFFKNLFKEKKLTDKQKLELCRQHADIVYSNPPESQEHVFMYGKTMVVVNVTYEIDEELIVDTKEKLAQDAYKKLTCDLHPSDTLHISTLLTIT